ncbi:GNAT family N-acetyltransferase [Nocardioides sp. GY 10127]|uniref:GNAT family N-acetyltransferase n=1 Tax=Nocardioides sp. GY 10127 TaxID=2569762 RepID=UPI0010A7E2CB|nr:GNAT family N-acetyltransferase [Nocardioides sp. GY 10127]TIC80907.1 GNAT family N-acetyltransferase [Nocardioides sp. GY 10127]
MASSPTADVSVRLAWADDAAALARLQLRAWAERFAGVLPPEAVPSGPEAEDAAAAAWAETLARPRDARHRTLVALERHRPVGLVVTAPASDPDCDPGRDGEVVELVVAAAERRRGHGSRLLQAAVDTLRADRFGRAVQWVDAGDDALRGFLVPTGWGPDGAHRELDPVGGGVALKQVRLHTSLADPGD